MCRAAATCFIIIAYIPTFWRREIWFDYNTIIIIQSNLFQLSYMSIMIIGLIH